MANSLRDQLLKAGLVAKSKPTSRPGPKAGGKRGNAQRQGGKAKPARTSGAAGEELDLARAYALRAQAEAAERKRAQAEAERQAKLRKERRQKLALALEGAALNKPDAELLRHFEYGGKIRRVHVDADQLARLNAGELGVVQQSGRYVLVAREVAERIEAFAPEHIALLVQPGASGDDDGIPDGLTW